MDFGANKTPVEVIKEGAFGGTHFRDIYSSVTGKWYKKSWEEFDQQGRIQWGFEAGISVWVPKFSPPKIFSSHFVFNGVLWVKSFFQSNTVGCVIVR